MKKSLRLKITLCLVGFVLFIILSSLLVSRFFLGDFYLLGKQRRLAESYQEINTLYCGTLGQLEKMGYEDYTDEVLAVARMEDRLEQMAEDGGMSILIFRDSGQIRYDYKTHQSYTYKRITYSSIGMETKDNIENNNMYNDYMTGNVSPKTIRATDQYVISQIHVARLSANYIYLSAYLDNGDSLLLRASYQSVDESADVALSFITYISIILLILGAIIMIIVTKRITGPITELSKQAKKIAELKFDTKYEVTTTDELGELGNSINYLSDSLEHALGELKTANRQLKKDLEIRNKNDEMRKEFLSNVSHELKTPIALIQGYAEGLMENVSDDEESRQFYCEVIADEASKMNNIVKKLLDLNQLEFGETKVNMQHFDVVEIIRNYLENSQILLQQKDIRLVADMPEHAYVWSDAFMVEEIFNNYLSNALNHVDFENVIKVSVIQNQDTVRVAVFNTGKHIPDGDIDHIWDKFYKVDKARTREYGGSGVGLSIVRASMEILGQDFGVANVEGGVEFYFELDSKNN